MSDAVSAAGLQSDKRRLLNHSLRKPSIGRLLNASFPENYVIQLSGHKNFSRRLLLATNTVSDSLSGRNESKAGSSSNINFDDSYDDVKVPSVFKIQNVVTSVISCSGYLSS